LEIVARLGMKQLIVPQANWKKVRKLYDVFQHMRAKNGHARSDSKVGVWIHCAATEEEARANAEWHGLDYMRGAIEHYELTGQQWDNVRGFETYANNAKLFREDESARNELLRQMIDYNIWGTPDQCIEKLIEISHMLDVSELMFVMKYGSMSFEVAEASMRLLAQEVLPVIKELEVQATQVPDPAAELEQLTASGAQ
jgi:alkanesulfonate monooxygenase SsuD/methylene tetrahydromethanopterin reductase-like flavin-dependent oxidoreductase (luciferase family)